MTTEPFLNVLLGVFIGAVVKFAFDRWGQQLGWSREERRDSDKKIERVDQTARDNIARVERELKDQLSGQGLRLERLAEQVRHLPTADDIEEVRRAVANVEREVSSAVAKIEGSSEMVRTIRDHILRGERA